jgi:uncharacterized protein (DUF1800 family)
MARRKLSPRAVQAAKSADPGKEFPPVALDRDLAAAIAVTRFGLGAKPGEIAAVAGADPQRWLQAQIRPVGGADQPTANPPSSAQRLLEFREFQRQRQAARQQGQAFDPVKFAGNLIRQDAGADFVARALLAAATDAGFRERWALFWFNHFTVSATKAQTATLIGPFEAEAIRPHVFGRFVDMLVASSSHPGMLLYLDQAQSVGPDTMAAMYLGRGGRHAGLNENLAREIMELHTVGLEAGYAQADVTEFARAMTGWSIGGLRDSDDVAGRFMFREAAHEPGVRTIMGKRYPQDGAQQALAVMRDLAASPHTAHHISLKLATHFVADAPPPSLVAQLERTWMGTGGDLAEVANTLVLAREAWSAEAQKFKTPYEFLVSSWRAAGYAPTALPELGILNAMGQKPYSAPSPKGWPEDAATWCAPDAVIKRIAWAQTLAAKALDGRDPSQLATDALGARLTPLVAKAIARAETREEGLAILLMSPEFQRR